ncbi:MAG: hypothetical protein WC615_00025 [Mucilaginibacter sp.]|jgi:hypothetical protein|uniref:nSTAND3 domain-containing NTPase n=1 Tax=Mucilaginibacter sp. TaxID=1882438 RepID=UPI003563266F
MALYDFSSLNSSDLELLVCDLLNKENQELGNGYIYQIFKPGKDKGIDFRHALKYDENHIVGQVKHYLNSGFDALIKHLKEFEKTKVLKLKTNRYIFATSLPLSVYDKSKIYKIFQPHIITTDDIHGQESLNQLLERYPIVLDNHFKLWYSSTHVLKKIIFYEILGRSLEFTEEYLKKKIKLFVETSEFQKAKKILAENRVIVISGDPGSGKTTLAEMLVYEYLKNDYHLTYLVDDVREINRVITADDTPQLFYYDDFLGHNAAEIQKAKSTESVFITILNRLLRAQNKYFIMTTRSIILKDVTESSQRFRDLHIERFVFIPFEKENSSFRQRILENHIDVSNLPFTLKKVIQQPKIGEFIIHHSSFSPRSVEYITNPIRVGKLTMKQYRNYIIDNFNYPDEIWRDAYEQQISEIDRLLLNTFYSLGDSVEYENLEKAFAARIKYETENYNLIFPTGSFLKSFRKLSGSFLIKAYSDPNSSHLKFANPSIVDFLDNYIKIDNTEITRITHSCVYVEQLYGRFYKYFDETAIKLMPDFLKQKLYHPQSFLQPDGQDNLLINLVFLLYNFDKTSKSLPLICNYLGQIHDFEELLLDQFILDNLKIIVEDVDEELVIKTLSGIGMPIFEHIIDSEYELHSMLDCCHMVEAKFGIEPQKLLKRSSKDLYNQTKDEFFNNLEEELDDLKTKILDEKELEEPLTTYTNYAKDLAHFGLDLPNFGRYFNTLDWIDCAMENQFRQKLRNDKD